MEHKILGDRKKIRYDEGLIDVVNKRFANEQRENNSVQKPDRKNNNNFFINLSTKVYKLNNVFYNSDLCSFAWDRELLDGGQPYTQEELIKISDKLPDAKEYYVSLLALYENKDGPQSNLVEEIRQLFAQDFENNLMMTGTRVIYKPKGTDKVIHNYGTTSENRSDIYLTGPNMCVNSGSGLENEMCALALLGTRDCGQVSKVFKWVTGKETYLRRVNHKPATDKERAVVFGVGSIHDDFIINVNGDISDVRSARGVVVVREKS